MAGWQSEKSESAKAAMSVRQALPWSRQIERSWHPKLE